jgi:hypothetical protein
MNCPICGKHVEPLPTTFDGEGFRCDTCGDYGISGSVLASKSWEKLGSNRRRKALWNAKRQAEPGKLPKITTYSF